MDKDFDKKLQDFSDSTYILGKICGLTMAQDIMTDYENTIIGVSKETLQFVNFSFKIKIQEKINELKNNPLVSASLKGELK
jgi:hypothetical protein